GGDANFTTSTSAAVSQTVNKASTATALASSANPSVVGQSVTFTATVTAVAPGTGVPTGTVTFQRGTTPLGTATLDRSRVATFAYTFPSKGTYAITATYGGDSNDKTSTSAALSQAVNAQLVLSGSPAATPSSEVLTPAEAAPLVTEALALWRAAGADPASV